jgi:hypothetical protein
MTPYGQGDEFIGTPREVDLFPIIWSRGGRHLPGSNPRESNTAYRTRATLNRTVMWLRVRPHLVWLGVPLSCGIIYATLV